MSDKNDGGTEGLLRGYVPDALTESQSLKNVSSAGQSKLHYGSKEFYKMLEEMATLHDKKSHDYASNSDPYGNYHFAGQISALFAHNHKDAGFAGRLAEKIYRLANLERDKKTPKNESIEDTERDLCVIMTLWMASRRENRRNKAIENLRKDMQADENLRKDMYD